MMKQPTVRMRLSRAVLGVFEFSERSQQYSDPAEKIEKS